VNHTIQSKESLGNNIWFIEIEPQLGGMLHGDRVVEHSATQISLLN